MTEFVVSRTTGEYNKMYLAGWDLIWGPIWITSAKGALRFGTALLAQDAADDAVAIMRPVAWCTPDFGFRNIVQVDWAYGVET